MWPNLVGNSIIRTKPRCISLVEFNMKRVHHIYPRCSRCSHSTVADNRDVVSRMCPVSQSAHVSGWVRSCNAYAANTREENICDWEIDAKPNSIPSSWRPLPHQRYYTALRNKSSNRPTSSSLSRPDLAIRVVRLPLSSMSEPKLVKNLSP